jgi:hypothetical protein
MVQTCIVHLIRNSLSFVSWKDRKAILPSIKAIYRAENADAARQRLEEFEAEWGKRYPAIGQAWRRAWEHVIPFLAFDRRCPFGDFAFDKTAEISRRRLIFRNDFGAQAGEPLAHRRRVLAASTASCSIWTTGCAVFFGRKIAFHVYATRLGMLGPAAAGSFGSAGEGFASRMAMRP